MKKIISALSIALLLSSCGDATRQDGTATTDSLRKDTLVATAPPTDTLNPEYSDYALYYIAIADTGNNYYALDEEMYDISIMMNYPIDTMGRYYDKKKKKIVLSDKDEDEMYRGEYFPRRGPDEHLSLEHLGYFDTSRTDNTMALMAGIYENQQSADSMVGLLKKHAPTAYTLKAWLYIGCMH